MLRARPAARAWRSGASRRRLSDEWRSKAERELGGRSISEIEHTTAEGLVIKPLYTAEDAPAHPPPPGVYPYTRGPYATMYTARPWTIRQYAGFSTSRSRTDSIGAISPASRAFRSVRPRDPLRLRFGPPAREG